MYSSEKIVNPKRFLAGSRKVKEEYFLYSKN